CTAADVRVGETRVRCEVTANPPAISTTDIDRTARPAVFNPAKRPSRRTSRSTRHFQTGAADAPSPTGAGDASHSRFGKVAGISNSVCNSDFVPGASGARRRSNRPAGFDAGAEAGAAGAVAGDACAVTGAGAANAGADARNDATCAAAAGAGATGAAATSGGATGVAAIGGGAETARAGSGAMGRIGMRSTT